MTAEQQAEFQRIVNEMNEHFIQSVATGRRMSLETVRALADGRAHLAAGAKSLGLIDGIQTLDATIAQAAAIGTKTHRERSDHMDGNEMAQIAAETVAPKAATAQEIEAACTGADATFTLAQLKANATVEQVKDAWIAQMSDQAAASEKATKEATEKAEAAAKKPGVEALGTLRGVQGAATEGYSGDAVADFDAKVRERMKEGATSRQAAVTGVARAEPELHQAFLLATNPGRKSQALISDRFEMERS